MKTQFAKLSLAALSFGSSAVWSLAIPAETTLQQRSAKTCADPTQAEVYLEGFSPSSTAHVLQRIFAFVHTDTTGGDWQIQKELFQAWGSPQDFTVPLYALYNPTTVDYSYAISTNGNPPNVASGLQVLGPVAYVYSTQVCGSVPLLALAESTAGDHWYTTSTTERDDFLTLGWTDQGTVAFVLHFSHKEPF